MKRVISVLKSVFFPKTCAGCGEIINEDDELCDYATKCLSAVIRLSAVCAAD